MYHLYSGSGSISDCIGTNRAIQVTVMISDQLLDTNGNPVQVTLGKPLPGSRFCYKMSDWCVSVDKIATFFGQTGTIGFQLLNPDIFSDKMWMFNSDISGGYGWGGEINTMSDPSDPDWLNPQAPGFGLLPKTFKCSGGAMGATINKLFTYPMDSGQSASSIVFLLQLLS